MHTYNDLQNDSFKHNLINIAYDFKYIFQVLKLIKITIYSSRIARKRDLILEIFLCAERKKKLQNYCVRIKPS